MNIAGFEKPWHATHIHSLYENEIFLVDIGCTDTHTYTLTDTYGTSRSKRL